MKALILLIFIATFLDKTVGHEVPNDISSEVKKILLKVHAHEKLIVQQNEKIQSLTKQVEDLRKTTETCCTKKSKPTGKSKTSPAKSCKWLRNNYEKLESGTYWVSLKEPTQVYCDMDERYGGGWTLIGQEVVEHESEGDRADYHKVLSNSISNLRYAQYNHYLLSSSGLRELQSYTNFTQIRFYCYKPWHRRTLHIYTSDNSLGRSVVNFMTERSKSTPRSCGSYGRFRDDNSNLGLHCEKWTRQEWNDNKEANTKMYNFPMYINNESHFSLVSQRIECDDFNHKSRYPSFSSVGKWSFYVR